MSGFEIFVLIMVCAIPIVSLLMVLPKIKKKDKNKEVKSVKTYEEMLKEEKKETSNAEQKSNNVLQQGIKLKEANIDDLFEKDFQSYAEYKKKNLTNPTKVELPPNFEDKTTTFINPKRQMHKKAPQNLTEEIRNLSPELKALIIAGVLDPKNFDNL